MLNYVKVSIIPTFSFFKYLYINKKLMDNINKNKSKKKINLSINKEILKKIEDLSTNKSRFVEYILLDYLHKNNINTKDIIL
jgi:hypothetical protein